ncbi:MAG TPA: division/cell wall cluster transcriptional repressor MraZ [Acidobacteriota bacterium]|nr:division/cell wall cluster transcriptional repressor MraZ [Acidobacteriota bacterium]
MVFRGTFPTKVDAQGRIKIPAAHRSVLEEYGSELYVTSVTGAHVLIYPMNEWEEIEARLMEPPRMLPEKIKFLRGTSFFGQTSNMDKQGRVLVQPHLRQAASIEGEVAVMGYLNRLEVWNKERFQRILTEEPFTDADAAALAHLGI